MNTDTMTVGVCGLVVAALMKKCKRKTRTVWVKLDCVFRSPVLPSVCWPLGLL